MKTKIIIVSFFALPLFCGSEKIIEDKSTVRKIFTNSNMHDEEFLKNNYYLIHNIKKID